MWIRAGICGLAVSAAAVVAGLVPGDSTRATVDHCYEYYTDHSRDTRCTGHWTRLGHVFAGQVREVEVPYNWHVISPVPQAGWYELTVPSAAREQPAVAVPGAALAVRWPVLWVIRTAAILAALALALLCARSASVRLRSERSASGRRQQALPR